MKKTWTKNKFTFAASIATLSLFLLITFNYQSGFAAPTAEVFAPAAGGVVIPEMDDFATNVLGDPWDMDEPSDLTRYRGETGDTGLRNSTFTNGIYSGQMDGDGVGLITLLRAGTNNNSSLRIGKIGYNFPINADKYRYLTFRMYKSCASCRSGLVIWYSEDQYSNNAVKGISESFSLPASAGWHIVTLDLKNMELQGLGEKDWSGTIRELAIRPIGGPAAANATVKLDWVKLTAEDPRASNYAISWGGGSGTIDIYASPNAPSLDNNDILLAADVAAGDGSLNIKPGLLPNGSYYIGLDTSSGMEWSNGPLIINQVPQVTILKPSKTSGEEYAQSVLGNAWDMNQSTDMNDSLPVGWETCISNPAFNGLFQATLSGCSTDTVFTDAKQVFGHMDTPAAFDPPIDTHKYRYLSFRYRLSGQQDVGHGWVARIGWWQHGANGQTTEADVMSRDIVLQEGWNTYKVDLWAPDIVDEAHPVQRSWLDSSPNRLRWDPAELYLNLLPKSFELDWIKLTAMEQVKRGDIFPIEYELSETNGLDLTFYYDTDTNPANGRSLIESTNRAVETTNSTPQKTTADEYTVYLPLVLNNFYPCSGNCFPWDTSSVPNGTYFVCIDVQDAYNSNYRCSEAPVIVAP